MTTTTWLAMGLVGGGLALVAVGIMTRLYAREEHLAQILDLPWGEQDVDVQAVATEQHSALVENTIGVAGRLIDSVDAKGSLLTRLERARVPVRPGEFALLVLSFGLLGAVLIAAIVSSAFIGLVSFVVAPAIGWAYLGHRIEKRRKMFESEFPDALSLIASSLSAGHTFLRAIQMMNSEAEGPIAEEFGRVVSETELGAPLIDALDNMAERVDVRDVRWVVQAIKIQQSVGGKLADLLHTLADFIRAREEVRREVQVLTAEGRLSAYVLGGLPLFLFLMMRVINPGYLDPMLVGWGPVWLGLAGVLTVGALVVILRMVKSVEV